MLRVKNFTAMSKFDRRKGLAFDCFAMDRARTRPAGVDAVIRCIVVLFSSS